MEQDRNQGSPSKELLELLEKFRDLKRKRWEEVEDSVQMSIRPGVPSEDWIIPPDEDKIRDLLIKDPEYVNLRSSIERLIPVVIQRALNQNFDLKHKLDWVRFTDPLIGASALDDAIDILREFTRK